MSSSQVSVKETWVATGFPSSALAQVIPGPCHTFQPQKLQAPKAQDQRSLGSWWCLADLAPT